MRGSPPPPPSNCGIIFLVFSGSSGVHYTLLSLALIIIVVDVHSRKINYKEFY